MGSCLSFLGGLGVHRVRVTPRHLGLSGTACLRPPATLPKGCNHETEQIMNHLQKLTTIVNSLPPSPRTTETLANIYECTNLLSSTLLDKTKTLVLVEEVQTQMFEPILSRFKTLHQPRDDVTASLKLMIERTEAVLDDEKKYTEEELAKIFGPFEEKLKDILRDHAEINDPYLCERLTVVAARLARKYPDFTALSTFGGKKYREQEEECTAPADKPTQPEDLSLTPRSDADDRDTIVLRIDQE